MRKTINAMHYDVLMQLFNCSRSIFPYIVPQRKHPEGFSLSTAEKWLIRLKVGGIYCKIFQINLLKY